MTSLGERVRTLRKDRKLTQERLAEGITSASMISQIESNRTLPSANLLQELARRLNVNPSYFQSDAEVRSEEFSAYRRAKVLMDAKLYAQAILYLKPLVSAPTADSLIPEADVYFDTALCYIKLERFTEAARVYEQCLSLSLTKQDITKAIYSYYYLGQLYFHLNTPHLARMYWQRAEALLKHHPQLVHPLTLKIYLGLARAQSTLRMHKLAEQNYQQAKKLALQSKLWLDAAEVYEELAQTYATQGLITLAEQHFTTAKDLYSVIHHQQGVEQSNLKLAALRRACLESRNETVERIQKSVQ